MFALCGIAAKPASPTKVRYWVKPVWLNLASTARDDPKIDYSLFFRLSDSANPTTRVLNRRSMVAWAYCLNILIVTIIGPRDAASILDHRVTETAHWFEWQD
jgi:hypothetical protein